jgi:phenylalanyl-tRNA synthetase alpha chain
VENTIERIYADAMEALASASDADAVNELSIEYLGRKGRITHYLRNISSLPAEQRPQAGKRANEIKRSLEKNSRRALTRMANMSQCGNGPHRCLLAGPGAEEGIASPHHPDYQPDLRHFFTDGV